MNHSGHFTKISRCERDRKKVHQKIQKEPNFISKVLADAFRDQAVVNLYYKLAYLREDKKFLDLGTVRYLLGNGYVMQVQDNENAGILEKPRFDFSKQMYRITKKGLMKIKGQFEGNRGEGRKMPARKPMRLLVASFGLLAAIVVAIILISNNTHADEVYRKSAERPDNRFSLIEKIARNENYGLVIFYYSGCYKCELQNQELKEAISILNWKPYLFIDLNESTVLTPEKYTENLVAAKNFGVETVPEIWLIRKDKEKKRVAYDYTPVDDVMFRIIETYTEWMNLSAGLTRNQ